MRINFRFILLGVLVGILSTIGFQELSNRYQPSPPWPETSDEAPGAGNTENMSSGSFPGADAPDGRDGEYVIVPRDHPLQQMRITTQTAVNSTNLNINIQDNGTRIQLWDTDSNRAREERIVPVNQTEYLYGKDGGFPVYIRTATNEVVRIDGIYHDLYRQEDKKYIIVDGDKLEVDFSDMDDVRLTPLLDQENGPSGQVRAEIDIRNYRSETNEADMSPLSIPLNLEQDDELMKQGFLPPREE
jgi:hypothetical protein